MSAQWKGQAAPQGSAPERGAVGRRGPGSWVQAGASGQQEPGSQQARRRFPGWEERMEESDPHLCKLGSGVHSIILSSVF